MLTPATTQGVLGDGSTWIGNTATEWLPDATQILDRFAAKEPLRSVGQVIFGHSEAGKEWIPPRYEELDAGR
jgi:hypothetical protein